MRLAGGRSASGATVAVLDNTGVTGLYHSSEGKEGDGKGGESNALAYVNSNDEPDRVFAVVQSVL